MLEEPENKHFYVNIFENSQTVSLRVVLKTMPVDFT